MGLGMGLGGGGGGGGGRRERERDGGGGGDGLAGLGVDMMPSISTASGSQVLYVDAGSSVDDTGMTTTTPNDGRIYDGDARAMHERAERIGHPIGVPHPTADATAGSTLDHAQEDRQRADANPGGTAALSTADKFKGCLLYTSPNPRDGLLSRMPSSA